MHPVTLSSKGTKTAPVVVSGIDPVRYVACSGRFFSSSFSRLFLIGGKGFPVDSHETLWLTLTPGMNKCPECGQVFRYDKEEYDDGHH